MYDKKGFTTGEVADLCHVTIPTVIKWIESGELEGFKIPGSKNRRITRESLLEFMNRYHIPTTPLEEELRLRVLVVDDQIEILELFKALLSDKKFDLRLVSRGFDAGLAKEFKPDLIILDIMLPDLDGRQVCQYVKEMPEMKNVKILGISGYVKNEKETADLLQKGFDDYIAKPFDNSELMKKIFRLINKKKKKRK